MYSPHKQLKVNILKLMKKNRLNSAYNIYLKIFSEKSTISFIGVCFEVSMMEPREMCMLATYSPVELFPHPSFFTFYFETELGRWQLNLAVTLVL